MHPHLPPASAPLLGRPEQIAKRIVDAILAKKLAPGARLGEQPLADLFGVSRTIVREALARLATSGVVTVSPRRGWFVATPSREAAREAFAAREAIETGMLNSLGGQLGRSGLRRIKQHLAQEAASLEGGDAARRSFLLGDFHVCLAECTGNSMLADILRNLTAHTTLIATMYQSSHEAAASCREHAGIVEALERGDVALAVDRMRQHLAKVADHLGASPAADTLDALRAALSPLDKPARRPGKRGLFTSLLSPAAPPSPSSPTTETSP